MTRGGLRTPADNMYQLLRDGNIKEFNAKKATGDTADLKGCDFRNVDLRGVDFRNCRMEGASINAAKVSGAYFPRELSAAEIELSLLHGTRLRYGH
ncbi:MAG: pentapeptide repeat-containing protein [Nitrospirota bacterium]|nr:pentapeptide repeat-containing protein [Nitrospirota bacterium]MDE3118710.1 pentapeptide repeat-containing protein [Nitrospirota bacterium]MDE3223976.1 pentapeptide repeat-containing protein [Nitrospirota bacterium]MDE3241936.1 pentapeptide repeat-containing protein [Nitrospirota bacterium]